MRARIIGLTVALVVLSLVWSGSSAEGQTEDLVRRGKQLYGVYCTTCHGESADGNGPGAEELDPRPADLRRITSGEDGGFPVDRIYRAIDGREKIPGHDTSSMPIWGFGFQELDRDVDQEDEVRGKILQIIEYLKSIQIEPARSTGS